LNASGGIVAILCAAMLAGGLWGGAELYGNATRSERRVALFETEAVATEARVVRVRHHDRNRRATVYYRYAAGGAFHTGATTVRAHVGRYVVGSQLAVVYLASDPAASWLHGYAPSRRPRWPALVIPAAALAGAAILIALIRRQANLLSYGRPAGAVVTRVEKKRSDKGTYWRVEYEWTLLSGATRRGRYRHNRKQPPVVGSVIPSVYDRERPSRHHRYQLPLVTIHA